jgi:hypothetical protein
MVKQLGTSQINIVRQLKETVDTEMQIVLTSEDLEESMAGKRARETQIRPLRHSLLACARLTI